MSRHLSIHLDVAPTPKGRPKASIIRGGNRHCPHCRKPLGVKMRPTTEDAEAEFALRIGDLYQGPVFTGPVGIDLGFIMPRPKGMFRKADPESRIWSPVRPDLDNLTKTALDALERCLRCGEKQKLCRCGRPHPMIADDGCIAWMRAWKKRGAILDRKARVSERPGVELYLTELGT